MFFTKKYKNILKKIQQNIELLNQNNDILKMSEEDKFLFENRGLRMDANRLDIFDIKRANFHLDRYNFACRYTENKIVLDVASGLGYGADIIASLGLATKVVGVELCKEAYEYSVKNYSSLNTTFYNGSILNLPFENNSFDVVTSFETIEHVEDEISQLNEIYRVLKNNGLYILSTPNDWNNLDDKNPYHVRCYTYDSLKEAISNKFDIINIYNQNSGSQNVFNKNQKRGICLTTLANHHLAECFIVVAQKK